jgi:hypothetical protein
MDEPESFCEFFNFVVGHRQFDGLQPSCHVGTPRLIKHKRGVHERVAGSAIASFTEIGRLVHLPC